MHRRLVLFLVFFVGLACGALRSVAEDVLAAATVKGGISVQLPRDWKLEPRDSGHILLCAAAPVKDSDNTGAYEAGLTITKTAGSAVDGAAQQARLAQDFPDYAVTEKPAAVNINGVEGVMFGGTFSAGSLKLRSRQYLLSRGDRIFTLTITSLASAWERHIGAAQASAFSFRIEK